MNNPDYVVSEDALQEIESGVAPAEIAPPQPDRPAVAEPSPTTATPTNRVRLSRPITVGRMRVEYLVALITVHALALLAFVPWLFSWLGFWLFVAGIFFYGQGINTCYHRLLTHRSFRLPRWLEHGFVIVSLCCLQDTPAKWVTTHRLHHLKSDTRDDPHSPLVSLFWSHCGWLLWRNSATHSIDAYGQLARDILEDRFYKRLEKGLLWLWIYLAHWVVYFTLGGVIGLLTTGTVIGALQLGLSLLIWGAILRTVAVWHITWSVNSLCHRFGYQNYATGEASRNNLVIGYLSVGEGWHNNHHHDPASACNQHRWWEIDVTWYGIRFMELLGLATRVIRPRHVRHARRRARCATRTGA